MISKRVASMISRGHGIHGSGGKPNRKPTISGDYPMLYACLCMFLPISGDFGEVNWFSIGPTTSKKKQSLLGIPSGNVGKSPMSMVHFPARHV